MGQVCDKLRGKQWREKQIRLIADKVFLRIKNQIGRDDLTFEDIYIAVLLIYNDINKRLPGPHFDPPTKDQVRTLMEACDFNLDGELDHEEFVRFIKQMTADTITVVSQGLIITLVVAPTVAMATKKATDGRNGNKDGGAEAAQLDLRITCHLSRSRLCGTKLASRTPEQRIDF